MEKKKLLLPGKKHTGRDLTKLTNASANGVRRYTPVNNKGLTAVFNIGPSFFHLFCLNKITDHSFNYLCDSAKVLGSMRGKSAQSSAELPLLDSHTIQTPFSKLNGKNSSVIKVNIYAEKCVCEKCLAKSFLFFGSKPADLFNELLKLFNSDVCKNWDKNWIKILIDQLRVIFDYLRKGIIYENLLRSAKLCTKMLVATTNQTALLEFKYSYHYFHMVLKGKIFSTMGIQEKDGKKLSYTNFQPFIDVGKEEIDLSDETSTSNEHITGRTESDDDTFYTTTDSDSDLSLPEVDNKEELEEEEEDLCSIISLDSDDDYTERITPQVDTDFEETVAVDDLSNMSSANELEKTEMKDSSIYANDLMPTDSTFLGTGKEEADFIDGFSIVSFETEEDMKEYANRESIHLHRVSPTSSNADNVLQGNGYVLKKTDNITKIKGWRKKISSWSSPNDIPDMPIKLKEKIPNIPPVSLNVIREKLSDEKESKISPTSNKLQSHQKQIKQEISEPDIKPPPIPQEVPVPQNDGKLNTTKNAKKKKRLAASTIQEVDDDYFVKVLEPPVQHDWNKSLIPLAHGCNYGTVHTCTCKFFSLCMVLTIGRGRHLSKLTADNLETLMTRKPTDDIDDAYEMAPDETSGSASVSNYTPMEVLDNCSEAQLKVEQDCLYTTTALDIEIKTTLPESDNSCIQPKKRIRQAKSSVTIITPRMAAIAVCAVVLPTKNIPSITRVIVPVVSKDILNLVKCWIQRFNFDQGVESMPLYEQDTPVDPEVLQVMNRMIDYVEIKETPINVQYDNTVANVQNVRSSAKKTSPRKSTHQSRVIRELSRLSATIVDIRGTGIGDLTQKCVQEYCKNGCICQSLSYNEVLPLHCGKESCLFKCSCPDRKVYEQNVSIIDKSYVVGPSEKLNNHSFIRSIDGARVDVTNAAVDRCKRQKKVPIRFRNSSILLCNDNTPDPSDTSDILDVYDAEESYMSPKLQFTKRRFAYANGQLDGRKTLSDVFIWCDIHIRYNCGCLTPICRLRQNSTIITPDNKKFIQQKVMSTLLIKLYYPNEIFFYNTDEHCARTFGRLLNYSQRNSTEIFRVKRLQEIEKGVLCSTNCYVKKKYVQKKLRELEAVQEIISVDVIKAPTRIVRIKAEEESSSTLIDVGENYLCMLSEEFLDFDSDEEEEDDMDFDDWDSNNLSDIEMPIYEKKIAPCINTPTGLVKKYNNTVPVNHGYQPTLNKPINNKYTEKIHSSQIVSKNSPPASQVVAMKRKLDEDKVMIDLTHSNQSLVANKKLRPEQPIGNSPVKVVNKLGQDSMAANKIGHTQPIKAIQSASNKNTSLNDIVTVDLTDELEEDARIELPPTIPYKQVGNYAVLTKNNTTIQKLNHPSVSEHFDKCEITPILKRPDSMVTVDLTKADTLRLGSKNLGVFKTQPTKLAPIMVDPTLEYSLVRLTDHPLRHDVYGSDNLPKLALLCLNSSIGYVPVVEFSSHTLTVPDFDRPDVLHRFRSLDCANLWINRFIKRNVNFESPNVNLKWVIVKPGIIKLKQYKPFNKSILRNRSCIVRKDGTIKYLFKNKHQETTVTVPKVLVKKPSECNAIVKRPTIDQNVITEDQSDQRKWPSMKMPTTPKLIRIQRPLVYQKHPNSMLATPHSNNIINYAHQIRPGICSKKILVSNRSIGQEIGAQEQLSTNRTSNVYINDKQKEQLMKLKMMNNNMAAMTSENQPTGNQILAEIKPLSNTPKQVNSYKIISKSAQ